MINGVLVERTVADARPLVETNFDGLKKVLEDLLKQYRIKQEEMDKWKVRAFRELSYDSSERLLITLYSKKTISRSSSLECTNASRLVDAFEPRVLVD